MTSIQNQIEINAPIEQVLNTIPIQTTLKNRGLVILSKNQKMYQDKKEKKALK